MKNSLLNLNFDQLKQIIKNAKEGGLTSEDLEYLEKLGKLIDYVENIKNIKS